ncbi:MAG: hypothetical protein VX460_00085, partial [Planctomycetota bacterium]|nr:hypothetical protein [Planctomycetota bacterium]
GPGDHGYAWVDGFSVDGDRCRAVTFKARTLEGEDPARGRPLAGPLAGLGGLVPASMFRPATVRAFNRVYHLGAAPWAARRELRTSLRAFLFPQDDAHPSNRVYGPRGVHGHHSLVPDLDAARAVLTSIRRSGPLVLVIKRFGDHPAPGMLSFTGPGLSIATGFLNEGERTLTGLAELDELVLSRGGRLYPAKDARMPAAAFARSFPEARAVAAHVAPAFTSNFWRRVRPVA